MLPAFAHKTPYLSAYWSGTQQVRRILLIVLPIRRQLTTKGMKTTGAFSLILGALVAGALAAGKDIAMQAIKDGYSALKSLIVRRLSSNRPQPPNGKRRSRRCKSCRPKLP